MRPVSIDPNKLTEHNFVVGDIVRLKKPIADIPELRRYLNRQGKLIKRVPDAYVDYTFKWQPEGSKSAITVFKDEIELIEGDLRVENNRLRQRIKELEIILYGEIDETGEET